MALAGDQVADGHEVVPPCSRLRRQVGSEMHDTHVAGAQGLAPPRDRRRVGERDPRRAKRRLDDGTSALEALGDAEHVAAVHADHERDAAAGAPDRIARRRRIVGVDHVEAAAQRERQRRRGPRAPRGVRARPRRRDERDVGDLEPVELGAQRLAKRGEQRVRVPRAQRGLGRHGSVQDEHLDVGPGALRRERLPVRPDPERRVRGARVVLGDDRDLHGSARYSSTVTASSRVTYARPSRYASASAIAASRG